MRKLFLVAIPFALGVGCVFNPQPDPPGVESSAGNGDYAGAGGNTATTSTGTSSSGTTTTSGTSSGSGGGSATGAGGAGGKGAGGGHEGGCGPEGGGGAGEDSGLAAQAVLGRKLTSHCIVAGPVDWTERASYPARCASRVAHAGLLLAVFLR